METRPLTRVVMRALALVITMLSLDLAIPPSVFAWNDQTQRNDCSVSETLNTKKSAPGTYTEEAMRKNVEGEVILCVTVNAQGKVTDVSLVSGPPELQQPSIDAARKWEFEAPLKAPAHARIEMTYRLTKPCAEGKGMDQGEIVTTVAPYEEREGNLKILEKLYQPKPPYPEAARAERLRGQLYLSIVVNPDGSVSDVRVTKALDDLLDKPAIETVRTWRFRVSSEGKPTKFSVTLSFRIPCLDGSSGLTYKDHVNLQVGH